MAVSPNAYFFQREDIWVTSKLWNAHHRPDEARAAIRQSIQDLGVDYLDLYLMHWSVAFVPGTSRQTDEDTSILDTSRVMEEFVRDNLTRHTGISNFAKKDVETVLAHADIRPSAHEFETQPYLQQQVFVNWHAESGLTVIAYSPLANTNPTYDSGDVGSILEDDFWKDLAEKKNAPVAQAVLAWGLARDTVVIPKSVQERHILENRGALDVDFSSEELEEIAKQDKKHRMNDPCKGWGLALFEGLDDPTKLDAWQEL